MLLTRISLFQRASLCGASRFYVPCLHWVCVQDVALCHCLSAAAVYSALLTPCWLHD